MSNTPSRIIYMDDGFSVTHAGMTSLLDSQTHPAHGETSILKMKTTIDAIQRITQEGVMDLEPAYRLANLSIHYDSLGRRNELIWGNRTTQVTYDRQNRIVERTVKGGVSAKFMCTKELRHPSTVELPGGLKCSLKASFLKMHSSNLFRQF
ncbi:unnamed protein product [Cylicocyclus nassatus]|uniref:Teneurin-like YD-shell domain-containing protein n=1 Tax=Cylicocyclus nassatus TaxID=53992 RepID=A0AA36GK42_CYLNA|nr:unnamed protein product [Cylicocyclus nassatus]